MIGFLSLGDAANWAQILGTVVPAILVVALWKLRNCRVPWCWRVGTIEVPDTHWKVCEHHHQPHFHEMLKTLHIDRFPDDTPH